MRYYINKDWKENGYIRFVTKCQDNVEQNPELFEECSIMNDDILEEINSQSTFYSLDKGKLIKLDKSTIKLNSMVDVNVSVESKMLMELINCLDSQGITLNDTLMNYLKGGE